MVTRSSIPFGVPSNQRKLRLHNIDLHPYCDRVKLILDAKRIPYEIVNVDPDNPAQSFLDISPEGKIPTLEFPDMPGALYESIIIVDYLEEAYPSTALYPPDPYRKGVDRVLVEKFNMIIVALLMAFDSKGSKGGTAILKNLLEFERVLEARGSKFFGGYKPGYVDYMIWPWFERMDVVRLLDQGYYISRKEHYPLLSQWAENMRLDPIVKKHTRPISDYYKYYKSKLNI